MGYIMSQVEKGKSTPRPPLSEAEIAARREADSKAVWSLRMEGLTSPQATEYLHQAFVNGELTAAEVRAELDKVYKKNG